MTLALKAATDGQGAVLAIRQLAQTDIDAGRLVIPFGPAVQLPQAYYVTCLADVAERPDVKAFRNWIRSQAKT